MADKSMTTPPERGASVREWLRFRRRLDKLEPSDPAVRAAMQRADAHIEKATAAKPEGGGDFDNLADQMGLEDDWTSR